MNLVFILAVALSVIALTPLALPLVRLALTALPVRSTTVDAPLSARELEQSVRDRLYGERPKLVTARPLGADAPTEQ